MKKSKVVFVILFIIWALISFIGSMLYQGVIDQNVPGYPKSGQLYVCVIFPFAMLILNIVILTKSLNRLLVLIITALQFMALFSFFFIVSGGI